jgi:hypothetical protein
MIHGLRVPRTLRFSLPFGLGLALIVPVAASRAAAPGEGPSLRFAGDPVFVGAGDIAFCGVVDTDEATAALLDGIEGAVFTAGDNAYLFGLAEEFTGCYEPTWGRHKARTRPAPGNHDYYSLLFTPPPPPYYAYFGSHAGPSGRGYYSYDLGAWHIVSLNSDVSVPAEAGSAQEQWLRADLAANPTQCTLAIWHHPVFNSGQYGDNPRMRDIWQALYEFGADVVISGHEHSYEQFHRRNATGALDENGIREFVVGTGGVPLRTFPSPPNPVFSAAHNDEDHGVLKLTLHPTSYDWEFVPIAGGTFSDVGSRPCVGSAPAAVGGRGFGIGGGPGGEDMAWTTGTAQTAYVVARVAGGGTTILPVGSTLPAAATEYTDTGATPGQFTCYLLLPLGGAAVIGRSDLLCIIPNSASSTGAPANVGVQLEQSSMATVTWSPPGGQTAYVLRRIPLDGTDPVNVSLPAVATRAMDETAGVPTCYVLLAITGGSVTGNSDVLCAIPGQSDLFTAGSRLPNLSVEKTIAKIERTVARLRAPKVGAETLRTSE